MSNFKQLGISQDLIKAMAEIGIQTPTEVQLKTIPNLLEDNTDFVVQSPTGTGKTAGFTLPLLHYLSENPKEKFRPIRALILTPTRELAAQVHESVKDYSEFLNISSMVIFGGVNQKPQVARLRQGVDVLIATPGRLLDLHLSLIHI